MYSINVATSRTFKPAMAFQGPSPSFCRLPIYRGAPHENCRGFKDGTVRPLSKRDQNQKILYNEHKRVHGLKVQCVVVPNGLIASLFGPVEGRRYDIGL